MPWYTDSPMAAALGAAGSYLQSSSDTKLKQQELKRQQEIDRQNAAITAAQLAEYKRLAQPVPLPAVQPTGKWTGSSISPTGGKTKPGGAPGKLVTSPGHLQPQTAVYKHPDVETLDDDIRQAQAWLAAGAQANRPDIIAAANSLLQKLANDKYQMQYHDEQMANTAAYHAATLTNTAAAHAETARHNRWNELHPRPAGGLNVTMGTKPTESNVYQFLSPEAQRFVDGLEAHKITPASAQAAIAKSHLNIEDKRLAGAYVSSPDYKGVKPLPTEVAWFTPIKDSLLKLGPAFPAATIARMESAVRNGTLDENKLLSGLQQAANDDAYASSLGLTSQQARTAYRLLTGQSP
jgi:hypothetical protein